MLAGLSLTLEDHLEPEPDLARRLPVLILQKARVAQDVQLIDARIGIEAGEKGLEWNGHIHTNTRDRTGSAR